MFEQHKMSFDKFRKSDRRTADRQHLHMHQVRIARISWPFIKNDCAVGVLFGVNKPKMLVTNACGSEMDMWQTHAGESARGFYFYWA